MGAGELGDLRTFYADCQEMSSNAQLMLDSAQPAMIFHLLVVDEEASADVTSPPPDGAPPLAPAGTASPLPPR